MKREPSEILSAFLDGETVEDLALAEALAAPGAREMLVDFVLLRGSVTSAADRPNRAFYERMDGVLEPPRRKSPWPAVAAAAAVITFAALGFWALRPPTDPASGVEAPPLPAPTRTLHFERGVDWQGQG